MLCAIITRRLLEKCLFPLNVLVVLKYTIILHVFVLLGLSCGWTVNDNSHAVHLMFQYFELNFYCFIFVEYNETYHNSCSAFSVVWLLMFNAHSKYIHPSETISHQQSLCRCCYIFLFCVQAPELQSRRKLRHSYFYRHLFAFTLNLFSVF